VSPTIIIIPLQIISPASQLEYPKLLQNDYLNFIPSMTAMVIHEFDIIPIYKGYFSVSRIYEVIF